MTAAGPPTVALVSSVGGLTALQTVLATLPSDFPSAVIALQHVTPDARSALAPILQRSTGLSVRTAADGEPLTSGTVLVCPPGFHTLVTHDLTVSLVQSGAFPPSRPSADLLLTTLALAAGPSAIAVVLTGYGKDGATGATAIHKLGGTVLTTDEETSEAFSMPAATIERDSIHPAVVKLDDVADLLMHLVLGSGNPLHDVP